MTEPLPRPQEHVSDISFDRAYAHELPAAEQLRLNAHLAECERCRERQRFLAEERAAFLAEAPGWGEYCAQRGQLAPVPKRAQRARWLLPLSAAVALAASFLLMSSRITSPLNNRTNSTHIKGGAQLGFYIKRGAQVSRGRADDVVRPDDVLRFTYSSPEPTYFALMGRDEHSAMLFYPVANQAAALPKGTDVPLGFGVEIDAQPGQERIYALFCSEPVKLSPIVTALERTDELIAPAHCLVRELRLNKVVP